MRLWRIAAETRTYTAADISGAGAAKRPGRWNDHGVPAVYCATTIAMAVLETIANVDDAELPLNRYLVAIDVPEAVWARRETLVAAQLRPGWDAIPAGSVSVKAGADWLLALRAPILIVPSVIVPEESNALINPRHPDAARISARVMRRFEYNRVLR